jgi:hypothetical protein
MEELKKAWASFSKAVPKHTKDHHEYRRLERNIVRATTGERPIPTPNDVAFLPESADSIADEFATWLTKEAEAPGKGLECFTSCRRHNDQEKKLEVLIFWSEDVPAKVVTKAFGYFREGGWELGFERDEEYFYWILKPAGNWTLSKQ